MSAWTTLSIVWILWICNTCMYTNKTSHLPFFVFPATEKSTRASSNTHFFVSKKKGLLFFPRFLASKNIIKLQKYNKILRKYLFYLFCNTNWTCDQLSGQFQTVFVRSSVVSRGVGVLPKWPAAKYEISAFKQ